MVEPDVDEAGRGAARMAVKKVVRRRKKESMLLRLKENILIVDWRGMVK
jgi:hypothetical protein